MTEQPIRVLAFLEAYVVNGAAKSLLNFCDSVIANNDKRVDIAIATFFRGSAAESDTPNEFVAAVRSRGLPCFVIAERGAFDIAVLPSLRRIVNQWKPDLILTNNVKSHFLCRIGRLHKGRHWIAVHHGYTTPDAKMRLFNKLDRLSLPPADSVLLVCGPFRDQLKANGVQLKKSVHVIHNSAATLHSLPEVGSFRQKHGIPDAAKVLLAIGRLSSEKGHADLLEALAPVNSMAGLPDWRMLFVGSGPERGRLESQAKELRLSDRVIFAGQQTDVLPYLALAGCMVLPSHTEGSPHVVLEAMSAGLPIIATRVGGVPEILTDEIATLVPPHNKRALTEALVVFLQDDSPAKKKALAAKQVLEQKFSHDAYRENMIRTFQTVLGRPA